MPALHTLNRIVVAPSVARVAVKFRVKTPPAIWLEKSIGSLGRLVPQKSSGRIRGKFLFAAPGFVLAKSNYKFSDRSNAVGPAPVGRSIRNSFLRSSIDNWPEVGRVIITLLS